MQLSWVAREQPQVETIDPVALQGETDRLAEALLPGISTVTYRARYYSFFCWALSKGYNDEQIHRREADLARNEHLYHHKLGDDECSYHGKRSAPKATARSSPSDVLAQSSWSRGYRSSCLALGLVDGPPGNRLTETGKALADYYGRSCRNVTNWKKAALCATMDKNEKELLKKTLGFDLRSGREETANNQIGNDLIARRETWRALCQKYKRWLPNEVEILASFARRSGNAKHAPLLQLAAGSSFIDLGLSALFYSYVKEGSEGAQRSRDMLKLLKSARPRSKELAHRVLASKDGPSLAEVLSIALGDLRRGLAIVRKSRVSNVKIDADILQIAESIQSLDGRSEGMRHLLNRHRQLRADDPWLGADDDHVTVNPERVPPWVRVSGLRLGTWLRLRGDLL